MQKDVRPRALALATKLRAGVPAGARSDPGGARPKAQTLVALTQRAGTETGAGAEGLLSLRICGRRPHRVRAEALSRQ